MKASVFATSTALLICSLPASAVSLGARGLGQVLLYPYYTVNHQQTLLSVANTTSHGKALKIRFRESYDGREVASFNVYLGPYDSWVGAVYDTSMDGTGAAAIASNDTSCTVPAFSAAPGALASLAFTNSNYSQGAYGTATGTDSGPTGLARTREGSIEIIEMGEVVDQAAGSQLTLEAITPSAIDATHAPSNCVQVLSAWSGTGYWTTNPNIDLSPPGGGVFGSIGIVDVEQGTLYSLDATAIDGFSDVAQHTGPTAATPNLGTAVTDSAHDLTKAYVQLGNSVVSVEYPVTRAVDAVSAVLMSTALDNQFNVEQALGASTDWVVTLPTKNFYVDPAIVGTTPQSAIPPFANVFGGGLVGGAPASPGGACDVVSPEVRDRNGLAAATCGEQCQQQHHFTCMQTNVMDFNHGPNNEDASGALGSETIADHVSPAFASGQVVLHMFDPLSITKPALRTSNDGTTFIGQPAIGFDAENYINANVSPGVLSNYSGAYPHRAQVGCEKEGAPCQ